MDFSAAAHVHNHYVHIMWACAKSSPTPSPSPSSSPSWSWSLPALVKRSEKQSWWDFAFQQMKSQLLYVWFVWFFIWKVKSQDWYVWSVGFCMPANWQTWLGSASWASLNYLHWASHRQCLGKLTIITIIIIISITIILMKFFFYIFFSSKPSW